MTPTTYSFHGYRLVPDQRLLSDADGPVKLGGRAFDTKVENATLSSGFYTLLTTGELESEQTGTQKESGFTPKLSVTWTPDDDFMA